MGTEEIIKLINLQKRGTHLLKYEQTSIVILPSFLGSQIWKTEKILMVWLVALGMVNTCDGFFFKETTLLNNTVWHL